MARRPNRAQREELRQEYLQDHPSDGAVSRAQPHDPDAEQVLDPEQHDWDDHEIWDM